MGSLLLMTGCMNATRSTGRAELAQDVAVQAQSDLREKIESFIEYFQSTLEEAAANIERSSPAKEHRKAAALWRVRMIEECRATANQDDAREVLVDVWTLCDRMHEYLTTGEGKSIFGASQPVAVACSESINAALEPIVQQFVPEASLASMREKIRAYGHANPIRGQFSVAPTERLSDTPEMEKGLGELFALPLAPLTALGAIGKTPESVRDVSKSVYRFSDVLEDLPASARWQLQLLAMNLEESPTVTTSVESVKKVSESSEEIAHGTTRFVQVVDEMPQKVRKEAEVLLKSVDESQPRIQTTLEQAQKTAATVRETVAGVDSTVVDVRESAVALEQAANAVTVTAREILKFIPSDMKDESGQLVGNDAGGQETAITPNRVASVADVHDADEPGSTDRDKSFSFQAVTESANSLGETTDKLRQLLGDVRTMLDDGSLSKETAALDTQMRGTVDFSALRLEGVVDHAAKRLAQLLVMTFVLGVIYRLAASRFTRSRTYFGDELGK